MEPKKRYCPICGTKSNELRCDICGRRMLSINERYKEKDLSLINDDIETFDHIQNTHHNDRFLYDEEGGEEQVNLDKVAKNVAMHSIKRKTTYHQTLAQEKSSNSYTILRGIAILLVIVMLIAIFMIFSITNN